MNYVLKQHAQTACPYALVCSGRWNTASSNQQLCMVERFQSQATTDTKRQNLKVAGHSDFLMLLNIPFWTSMTLGRITILLQCPILSRVKWNLWYPVHQSKFREASVAHGSLDEVFCEGMGIFQGEFCFPQVVHGSTCLPLKSPDRNILAPIWPWQDDIFCKGMACLPLKSPDRNILAPIWPCQAETIRPGLERAVSKPLPKMNKVRTHLQSNTWKNPDQSSLKLRQHLASKLWSGKILQKTILQYGLRCLAPLSAQSFGQCNQSLW